MSLLQRYSVLTSQPPLEIQIDPLNPSKRQGREAAVVLTGNKILTLFFHQIITQSTWILDFRSDAFEGTQTGGLKWRPQPYFYEISPVFLAGVRSLYQGFYRSDDALFDQALSELGLSAAGQSLRNHFGVGDQSQVYFQLKTFQNTFTEVFDVCAREGVKLQPEFFVLGIILLGLYENLEILGVSFDARACFESAFKMSGAAK